METKEATDWFDKLYKESDGDDSKIPWASMKENEYLIEYLESKTIEKDSKAIVIGCGLGDDAIALEKAGFDVTAIDISSSAIEWCKKRFPNSHVNFKVVDLFSIPNEMLETYDFIFEFRTVQSLPVNLRDKTVTAICSLLRKNAHILVGANGRNHADTLTGPPWPLTREELNLFCTNGLKELEFHQYNNKDELSTLMYKALYINR